MSKLGPILSAALASLGAAACAASESSTPIDAPTGADRPLAVDAPGGSIDAPGGSIDAPTGGGSAIGMACVGDGQGSCPTGYQCLNLQGGSGSWCSRPCTGQNDLSCSTGYTGPGFPACYLTVTPAGGGTPQPFCTVVCFDAPGAPTLCPGGDPQCNNTCPSPLACTADLPLSGGGSAGRLCQ